MGEAVATGAGRLHARWVVHTVGPVWPGPGAEADARRELLRGAYRNSLGLAARLGAASVALPAVSAGIYGWPADDAAAVALATASAAARMPHPTACASCSSPPACTRSSARRPNGSASTIH